MQPNEGRRRFHPATHVHGASEHQGLEFDPIRDRGDREDVRLMTGTAQRCTDALGDLGGGSVLAGVCDECAHTAIPASVTVAASSGGSVHKTPIPSAAVMAARAIHALRLRAPGARTERVTAYRLVPNAIAAQAARTVARRPAYPAPAPFSPSVPVESVATTCSATSSSFLNWLVAVARPSCWCRQVRTNRAIGPEVLDVRHFSPALTAASMGTNAGRLRRCDQE